MNDFDFRKKYVLFYKRTVIYSLRIRINYLSKYKYLLIYCNKLIKLFFIKV